MSNGCAVLAAVVVGAGQAGLAVSYFLSCAGVRHRLLERGRIGESWLTQRWDSFRLNTTNAQSIMPDRRYEGLEPEGFMTHQEWAGLLERFVERNRLPVELGTPVKELTAAEDLPGTFRVCTPHEVILTRNVVIASGAYTRPRLPASARAIPSDLTQIHSADYRNPAALPPGSLLVIGAGQSGCQIAEELLGAKRTVYLSTCRVGRAPRRYRGRDLIDWSHESGLADVRPEDLVDRSVLTRGEPQIAPGHTISLQSLSARGAMLLGRFATAEGGRLRFADDLAENIRFADQVSEEMKRRIDAYIERSGLTASPAEADPAEVVAPRLADPPILSLEPSACGISTVVWCTGLEGDFGWVSMPGILDEQGRPAHEHGVTSCPGVYFTGLPWLSARRSGLVTGVGHDAPRIAELVAARCR
jgi:putative flavoprotein involved in K+ transport